MEPTILQYQRSSYPFAPKGRCGLALVPMGMAAIAILSALPGDVGISVTNGIEDAATEAYRTFLVQQGIDPHQIVWIEHYPENSFREETFDRVTLDWNGPQERFLAPRWEALSRDGVTSLIRSFGVTEDIPVLRFDR